MMISFSSRLPETFTFTMPPPDAAVLSRRVQVLLGLGHLLLELLRLAHELPHVGAATKSRRNGYSVPWGIPPQMLYLRLQWMARLPDTLVPRTWGAFSTMLTPPVSTRPVTARRAMSRLGQGA